MGERNLDFDTVIERKNTNCLKYDFARHRGMPEDVLPLWVADMDFKISSYIQDTIEERNRHGIYGYTEAQEAYFEAVSGWMERQYSWKVDRRWMIKTPGVVFALAMAVKAYTETGDSVLIQQPVYYPFSEVIEDNDRRIVNSPLMMGEDGRYRMDISDFEEKIVREKVKLFLLCNPHNPVGRSWSREELERVGDICLRYGVVVVSDEIHADFVFSGKHHVFCNLKEEYRKITVTCTAPSKTFNLAGLQISNIFIAAPDLKKKFKKQVAAAGYSQVNTLGLVACEAAYRYGEKWYKGVCEYIRANIEFVRTYLREKLPAVKMIEPEGTYLVWLDFRALGMTDQALEHAIVHQAKLWLDGGAIFGDAGKGFQRINVACPRATLQLALDRLASVFSEGSLIS